MNYQKQYNSSQSTNQPCKISYLINLSKGSPLPSSNYLKLLEKVPMVLFAVLFGLISLRNSNSPSLLPFSPLSSPSYALSSPSLPFFFLEYYVSPQSNHVLTRSGKILEKEVAVKKLLYDFSNSKSLDEFLSEIKLMRFVLSSFSFPFRYARILTLVNPFVVNLNANISWSSKG